MAVQKRFAQMLKLEQAITDRKRTMSFANEARMPDYRYVQHQTALRAERAELFALVDVLTSDEAIAYAAYRLVEAE